MPFFKQNNKRAHNINNSNNNNNFQLLDIQHSKLMNEFKNDENIQIPKLNKSIDQLQKQINITTNKNKIMNLTSMIRSNKNKIKKLKKKKNDYLLDNSKYIFEYFENKKNISNDKPDVKQSNKLLDTFFNLNKQNNIISPLLNDDQRVIDDSTNDIVNKYLCNVNNTVIDINKYINQSDICKSCHKGELIVLEDEGVLICKKCFIYIPYLFDNEKPSYKDPPKEVCFYAYKRINHFKEILAQFQGKETTQIPNYVIENIKLQIKKERIVLSELTNINTKYILKKLGYNKYYEHIPFINDQLGIKPPIMSQALEETLCNLFLDIQVPYSKYCPENRVNFLNYYYTAYKLCEILGEYTYLSHFQMLKDNDKRIEQDDIWKKICNELNWVFIPTL
jgi:hypothetical protein